MKQAQIELTLVPWGPYFKQTMLILQGNRAEYSE